MAGLAAVLRLWLSGRERDAFRAFDEFDGVPEGLAEVVAWPRAWFDRAFAPVPMRGPWGDCWLTCWATDALPAAAKVPVVSLHALWLFLGDWARWAGGEDNPHWGGSVGGVPVAQR